MKQQRIEQWLSQIADEALRSLSLSRMSKFAKDTMVGSLHKAIEAGIDQGVTPEGFRFWQRIQEQAEMGNIQLVTDKMYTLKDLEEAYFAGKNDLPLNYIAKIEEHVPTRKPAATTSIQ